MSAVSSSPAPSLRVAVLQAIILLGLCVFAFTEVFVAMIETGTRNPEACHALATVGLIAILLHRRRRAIVEQLSRGSGWGIVLILLALGIYVFASWPFNYAIPRRMALVPALAGVILAVAAVVPALAGVILAVAGPRVAWRCLPLVLMVMVAIPVGSRFYSAVIIRPETITLSGVRSALELLPGVFIDLDGLDLSYVRGDERGAIALGASYRGASLLLSFLTLGLFVTFARIRPAWQVVIAAVAAGPIVFACNFARLFLWGVVTICTGADPVSLVPRLVATVASLVLAYLAFGLIFGVLNLIVAEAPPPDPAPEQS